MLIKDIQILAYTLYKIDWLRRISHDRIADLVKNYYEEQKDCSFDDWTIEDYFNECGFNGEMYACFDEFIDTEYRDKEYMQKLLDNSALYDEYLANIKTLNDPYLTSQTKNDT